VSILTLSSTSLILIAFSSTAYGLIESLLATLIAALLIQSKAPYMHLQRPMKISRICFFTFMLGWFTRSNILMKSCGLYLIYSTPLRKTKIRERHMRHSDIIVESEIRRRLSNFEIPSNLINSSMYISKSDYYSKGLLNVM
jgi:hypothetical protein